MGPSSEHPRSRFTPTPRRVRHRRNRYAREVDLAGRINIVPATYFFALLGESCPAEKTINRIKDTMTKTSAGTAARSSSATQAAVDARWKDWPARSSCPSRSTSARGPASIVLLMRRSSCARSPQARCWPASATSCRSARCRSTASYPAGPRRAGSATLSELVAVSDEDICVQCRNCSFVCPHQRDPLQGLRQFQPGEHAAQVPVGPAEGRRPARQALHAPGLRRGLHGLRPLRRGLPRRRTRRPGPQGDQPPPESHWSTKRT